MCSQKYEERLLLPRDEDLLAENDTLEKTTSQKSARTTSFRVLFLLLVSFVVSLMANIVQAIHWSSITSTSTSQGCKSPLGKYFNSRDLVSLP